MDPKESLIELFDYDRWASRLWVETLPTLPFGDRAEKILRHNLGAQRSWLARVIGEDSLPPEAADLGQAFDETAQAWKELIASANLDAYVTYQNFAGETYTSLLSEIARHVINHGTYHRGHLRGLAEAAGFEGFPETDFIRYCRLEATAR